MRHLHRKKEKNGKIFGPYRIKVFYHKEDRKNGHIQDRGWNVYWSYKCIKPSLGDLSNKQDWKKIGEFGDVNEHVISNIKNYQELRVNFMLYYSGRGVIYYKRLRFPSIRI